MAADTLATLGLRLDAEGMVVGVRRVRGELTELGVSGRQVQARVKTFATESAFAISSLAGSGTRDLTQVAKSLSGLGFAFGAQVGIITLAVSSIADAFSEQARQTKEEQDKMLAELRSFVGRYSQEMLRIQISAKEARISQLQGQGEEGLSPLQRFGRQFMRGPYRQELASPFQDRIQQMTDDVHKLRLALVEMQREEQKAFDEKAPERFARSLHSINEGFDAIIRKGLKEYAKSLADSHDESERFRKAFSDPVTGAFSISASDIDAIARAVGKTADALMDAARKAERMKDALKGMKLGAGVSLLNRFSPEIGGIASGAVSGFMAAGPQGAALGAGMALVDTLFGLADSAKQAREAVRQLRGQFEAFTDGEKEALGIISGLDARIRQVNRTYGEQREALKGLVFGVNAHNPARLEEYNRRLQELNDLENRRIDSLKREAAELEKLKEMERLDEAIGKVQGRIASLASTIGGLTDFRNALKLADTISPIDRLAEARKQYEATLAKAKGFTIPGLDGTSDVIVPGDEDAARRLPAIAQTLLELSRMVNASGAGFQTDYAQVMRDTEGLIEVFTGMKSVEEQMLAELQLIRTATEKGVQITEELIKPVGKLPTVGGGTVSGGTSGTGSGGESTAVLSSGFTLLIAEVREQGKAQATEIKKLRQEMGGLLH